MQVTPDHRRLLALDVRPRQLGYAVFAGPDTLLHWGIRNFRGGVNAVRIPFESKVAQLLVEWQPAVVVLNEPPSTGAAIKIQAVQTQAQLFQIPFLFVTDHAMKDVFRDQRNKHERASALASKFPELSSRLPPKRKPWQSEDYRLRIFDAVALGVANFRRSTDPHPGPDA